MALKNSGELFTEGSSVIPSHLLDSAEALSLRMTTGRVLPRAKGFATGRPADCDRIGMALRRIEASEAPMSLSEAYEGQLSASILEELVQAGMAAGGEAPIPGKAD
jgi:hypothetical protein